MAELLNQINSGFVKKSPVFYKGWFGRLHQVEIIIKEKWRGYNYCGQPFTFYKYVIKFKSGRTKYVEENKLIMKGED